MAGTPASQAERIPYLIGKLTIPDEERLTDAKTGAVSEGLAARNELIAIGEPAVPALIEALKSKDDWTKAYALEALGAMRERKAVAALIGVLHGAGKPWIRETAAYELGGDR